MLRFELERYRLLCFNLNVKCLKKVVILREDPLQKQCVSIIVTA